MLPAHSGGMQAIGYFTGEQVPALEPSVMRFAREVDVDPTGPFRAVRLGNARSLLGG